MEFFGAYSPSAAILFPVAISISFFVSSLLAGADARVFSTYMCYFFGSVLATVSLRRGGITSLLGPMDRRLDLYAEEAEFLADWRQVSLWRLAEVICLYVFMLPLEGEDLLGKMA